PPVCVGGSPAAGAVSPALEAPYLVTLNRRWWRSRESRGVISPKFMSPSPRYARERQDLKQCPLSLASSLSPPVDPALGGSGASPSSDYRMHSMSACLLGGNSLTR